VAYNGSDPHTNHAHFSARYETDTEADTRPWGVAAASTEDEMTPAEFVSLLKNEDVRAALCSAVWRKDDVIPAPRDVDSAKNSHWAGESYLFWDREVMIGARQYAADSLAATQQGNVKIMEAVAALNKAVADLAAKVGTPGAADLALAANASAEAIRTVLRNGVNGA
jgi:hypothetical protein